tara:strand:- start:62 stop:265 length:204 start_codon:yes stop_codon:yes gene_type:complete
MTPQLIARHSQGEPRVHVQVDQWMTEADLARFWHSKKQQINDARHEQQPLVPGFTPIGHDSEGGGHD